MKPQDVPILLVIFNRPDKVKKLIERLSEFQPSKLYVVADGPRDHKPEDAALCQAARQAATNVNWPCEVTTKFFDTNLRTTRPAEEYPVVQGIDWLFTENEIGIILEDDCMPDLSFFSFCTNLLEKYKDDERIMHISGDNFQDGQIRGDGSYYFSHFTAVWGWATWRRAWSHFHPAVADMDNFFKDQRLDQFPLSKKAKRFGTKSYRSKGHWDSLWQYTVLYANGINIMPNQNLVTNIGFGDGATNTNKQDHPLANMPVQPMITITHPSKIEVDVEADQYYFDTVFFTPLLTRIRLKIGKIMRHIMLKVKSLASLS